METELEDSAKAFLEEAFPSGSVNLLLTPSGPEREAFLVPLILQALHDEEPLLAVLSNTPPKKVLAKLDVAGREGKSALLKGRFRILDWYSHKEGSVTEAVEERGILRCPGKLDALEPALDDLLNGEDGKGLAVLEFLTDATWFGKERALDLANALVKKAIRAFDRAIVVLDSELVAPDVMTRLEGMADGVVRLRRERSEVGPAWKVSVAKEGEEARDQYLSMKPPFVGFTITAQPEAALVSQALPPHGVEASRCPRCGGAMEDEACISCGYGSDEGRLKQVRAVLQRCEDRLVDDPNDADALFTKSVAQARLRGYDEAIETLNRLARLDPRYPALWMLKAKIYERVGDDLKAKLCRQRALELEETDAGAALAIRHGKEGFQCPLCLRWLPLDATACPCGAEFDEE
ncbi:MAG: tetratricopeptide repeat protein [Thermoplasmata archaeon]|nr:tetratricopeptide repeat protein [Thermoplasmata archaeon]